MAGRKARSNVLVHPSAKAAPKKKARRKRSKSHLDSVPAEQWDEVMETAYAVESFPIRRLDMLSALDFADGQAPKFGVHPVEIYDGGWRSAYSRAHWSEGVLQHFRALLVDAGVVVGLDEAEGWTAITAAIEAIPVEVLYAQPPNETERVLRDRDGRAVLYTSERQKATEWLSIPIMIAFQDLVEPLLRMAVDVAREAAVIVGRDVCASPRGARSSLRPAGVDVRRVEDDDRELLVRRHTAALRRFLRDALRDQGRVRSVGRRAEEDRDHRAYCLRERLIRSEGYVDMKRNERFALARETVIREVIAPAGGGCSHANFQRIMDHGKAIHARAFPDSDFCAALSERPGSAL